MEFITTLHVIGFKNSGKTTLLNRWIQVLKKHRYTVSVIKHHGHKSKLAMPDETKDSMQYITHGADASFVSGGGFTQQIFQTEMDYDTLKKYASIQSPDIILVEGFKETMSPKVVIVRNESDWEQLKQLDGIVLVIGNITQHCYDQIHSRDDELALNEWLFQWIKTYQ